MLCWIASASHCFCDNEHQCHAPQHHKYVPYSFRKPKGNGSYRVKNQNSCKERTSYLFPASKRRLCSSRHSPLLQLAAVSSSQFGLHSPPSLWSHWPHSHSSRSWFLSWEFCMCLQSPHSTVGAIFPGFEWRCREPEIPYSISHTYLSHLILHSCKAGTENDWYLEFQSFVSFCCGLDFVLQRSTLFISLKYA